MLKLKYLFENYELAKYCSNFYDVDPDTLDEMIQHYRISSNAVYPFRTGTNPDKVCFLRLSPAEEKSFHEVESEIQLLQWLIEQGFPAMRPYAMKDGRLSAQVDTSWGLYNVSCFEKVAGEALDDADGSMELVSGYGRTLGELHKLMKCYPYCKSRKNHEELMREIHERLTRYHAPQDVLEEWNQVKAQLDALPVNSDCYGIVHYDFEPDNVMYNAKLGTFGVIDFDDAIRCWYTLDVARAIDSLDDIVGEGQLDEAEKTFLTGYCEAVSFSDEQQATMPLMRRLVHLQEYSTILHVLSVPVSDEPEWMTELVNKLQYKFKLIENGLA